MEATMRLLSMSDGFDRQAIMKMGAKQRRDDEELQR